MAKNTVNSEKVKIEFEKATIQNQIEAYYNLGVWLHEKIGEEQKRINDTLKDLQDSKEKIKI